MEKYTLVNGVEVPKIGFGTWQIPEGKLYIRVLVMPCKLVMFMSIQLRFIAMKWVWDELLQIASWTGKKSL